MTLQFNMLNFSLIRRDVGLNFNLWIKNETQLNIGTLKIDHGDEYISKDLKKYL